MLLHRLFSTLQRQMDLGRQDKSLYSNESHFKTLNMAQNTVHPQYKNTPAWYKNPHLSYRKPKARLAWLALQEWADNGCPVWQDQQYLAICFSASHSLQSNTSRVPETCSTDVNARTTLDGLTPPSWYHTLVNHVIQAAEALMGERSRECFYANLNYVFERLILEGRSRTD